MAYLPTRRATAGFMDSFQGSPIERVVTFLKQPGWALPTIAAGAGVAWLLWRSRKRRR